MMILSRGATQLQRRRHSNSPIALWGALAAERDEVQVVSAKASSRNE